MAMALESEFGSQGDVEDDFEKLMVTQADLRVMIFQADDDKRLAGC